MYHRTSSTYAVIRRDILDAMDRYGQHHIPLGDFLTAVMANDLMAAIGRADDDNRQVLWNICGYVYNELPSQCHGSPAIVEAWLMREPVTA